MSKNSLSELTGLFPDDEQKLWLDEPSSVQENNFDRIVNIDQAAVSSERFSSFRQLPEFDTVIPTLKQYVSKAIPAYKRTEGKWWIVSCMPSTTLHRIAAISINWMETFVIFHDQDNMLISSAFIIVSENEFRNFYPDDSLFHNDYENIAIRPSDYKAAGTDQICIEMNDLYTIIAVLQNKVILRAARELNLRVMKRGKTPYSNYHSYQLADWLIDS